MSLRQSMSMRPELRVTALQLLTTRLLAEPIAKLEEEIEDALADNEFLVRLDRPLPVADRRDADTMPSESVRASEADLWFPDEPTLVATEQRDPIVFENHASGVVTLAEHLLDQLRHSVAAGALRVAAEAIIWNLDDNGYLRSELTDIANASGTPLDATQRALELVQSF